MKTGQNILIIGKGRHGKDQIAEMLRDWFGYTFTSSSKAMYEIFIYDLFKEKYGYETLQEAYEVRNDVTEARPEPRKELFELIQAYNTPDKTKLARAILDQTGMYVGMRCKEEVEACIAGDVFDLIIWVDASERVDYVEDSSSITVTKAHADIIIDNNGTLEDLERKVKKLGALL